MGGVKNRDCRFQAELCMQQAAENCEQHRAAFEAFPGSLRIHIYVEELVGQLSLENSLDSNREFEKGCKSYRSPCEACMYIVCMYVFASQLKPFLLMHTYHIYGPCICSRPSFVYICRKVLGFVILCIRVNVVLYVSAIKQLN